MSTEPNWEIKAGRCGSCTKFIRDFGSGEEAYGHCPVKSRAGSIGTMTFKCDAYVPIASVAEAHARRVTVSRRPFEEPLEATKHPERRVRRRGPAPAPGPSPEEKRQRRALRDKEPIDWEGESMDRGTLREIIQEAIEDSLGLAEVTMVDRYVGGTVEVKPGVDGAQSKEIPIDQLMRKIIGVRDNLRVLEAKINGSDQLDDATRIQFQQYITRCYGSLTTFNFLFKDRDDQFRGAGSR